ncbi:MAG: ABC transporter substrate-binding protein [Clostridia bacterium]|nr:ABC transporter substrate-binding protein [Clostridia bacterium]
MKKKALALLLCIAFVLSVCGCGKETPAQVTRTAPGLDTSREETIFVCGSWGNFEALDAAAQLFRAEYPNVRIVYEQLGDYGSDLRNRFVSGQNIDLYMADWFLSNDERYSYLWDNAVDLTGKADLSAIPAEYLATGVVGGKQYAVPVYTHSYGLMVNEDLLQSHGLQVPATFDEFLHCCEVLRDAGLYPLLGSDREYSTQVWLNLLYGAILGAEDPEKAAKDILSGNDGTGTLAWILERMEAFNGNGFVHPDSANLADTYNSVIMRFFEGDIAFVTFPTSSFSGTKKREAKSEAFTAKPFRYSFIATPGVGDYEHVVQQLGTVYLFAYKGIPEEKLPYVLAFLEFLSGDAGSKALSEVKNMPTANANVGNDAFPRLKELGAGKTRYVGANAAGNTMLELNRLLRVLPKCMQPGMTAGQLLESAIAKVNE